MKEHYSYAAYADPDMARNFDARRFGGPIGAMVAGTQARVLANMVGRIDGRPILDVGTGTGRAALFFARGGAVVTAIDALGTRSGTPTEKVTIESVTIAEHD